MTDEELKKIKGVDIYNRLIDKLKRGELRPRQVSAVCKRWLILHDFVQKDFGFIKKSEFNESGWNEKGTAITQQLNPLWKDEYERRARPDHYHAKRIAIKDIDGKKKIIYKYSPIKSENYNKKKSEETEHLKMSERIWESIIKSQP